MIVDYYDTDTLSKEIGSCSTLEELERLYEAKLANKRLNVVDIVIIQEMFGGRMEELGIDFLQFKEKPDIYRGVEEKANV